LRGNTASNVTGIGYFSADGNSGSGLCAFGGYAGYSNSGNNVTAFGYAAAYDCAANNNVAVGDSALAAGPCTGVDNTCGGYFSGRAVTSGTLNSAWGANSLNALTTGASNVGIGSTVGNNLTTGSNNTIIGAAATVAAAGNDNSIVIGKSAVGLGSNTTVIGTSATTANRIFGVQSTGQVAPTIASASTIAPTKQITFISGTTAIDEITAPTGIATTGGQITLIPTGIFTTTTNENIALASTAVVGRALIMTYDATTGFWYPSY
jgi:hypothetical protein